MAAPNMSFKKLAQLLRDHPDALPTELTQPREAAEIQVLGLLRDRGVQRFGLRIPPCGRVPAQTSRYT